MDKAKGLTVTADLLLEMTPAVRAFVEGLLRQRAEMQAEIDDLKAQVGRLTPKNSSVPPSTQHPHARPPRKAKPKSKRKRGGQRGHRRSVRELVPVERCAEVVVLRPEECRRCGAGLSGDDPEPLRRQVWDLPPIEPVVVEHQLHRRTCGCGAVTGAALPAGVPNGMFGIRLLAFSAMLTGHFRQSKRRAALFLTDLLNMPCSPAATVKMQNRVAAALEQPYEQLKARLPSESHLFMDESPTKEANQKAWLWTAVASSFAVFAIFARRAATALPALIGENFAGLIHCDRAKMYWREKRLQWCWAHLKRNFQALIDHPDRQVKRQGHDLMRQVDRLFALWHERRAGKISWTIFQTRMKPVRAAVEDLLRRGKFSKNRRLVGRCRELHGHRDWRWAFAETEGLEPTNNAAERALRPAVIYRKLSFGTQSAAGSRFVERMLTVSETCRLQQRSFYQWLVAAVEAHQHGRPAPPLLASP